MNLFRFPGPELLVDIRKTLKDMKVYTMYLLFSKMLWLFKFSYENLISSLMDNEIIEGLIFIKSELTL